jgi:hypothetical protein
MKTIGNNKMELPAYTSADRPTRERITLYEALATKGMTVGSIVQSMAGHDYGRLSVILAIQPPFAFVSEGKYRSVTNPKKKRLSHLRLVGEADDQALTRALLLPEEGQKNSDIRRLIRRCTNNQTVIETQQPQDHDQNP